MADSARELYLKNLAKTLTTITSRTEYEEWIKTHPQYNFTFEDLLEGRSLLERDAKKKPTSEKKQPGLYPPPPPLNKKDPQTGNEESSEKMKSEKKIPLRPTLTQVIQPTVLHSHRKEAEKALIHDWGEKYKATEREITEARRKQLVEKFQKELEKHNAQAKNDFEKRDNSWVRKQVNEALYYFSRGADVTRGQLDPSGKPIRTEIDTLTDALFKKKYGRDWHHAYEKNDPQGEKTLVPASPSLSLEEIENKARELYPDIYTNKPKRETITSRTIPYMPPDVRTPSTEDQEEVTEITEISEPTFPIVSGGEDDATDEEIPEQQNESTPQQKVPSSPRPIASEPDDDTSRQDSSAQQPGSRPSRRRIRQGQRVTSGIGKKLATRAGTQAALSGAGSLAGTAAGGVGGAAAGAGGGAAAAGAGAGLPVIAIILAIVFVIILIIIVLVVILGGGAASQIDNSLIPVTLTKTADKIEVPNPINSDLTQPDPSDVTYTLNVSYPGRAQDVVVTDPIPQNSTFVKATGIHDLVKDASGRVLSVSWSLKANQSPSTTEPEEQSIEAAQNTFDQTKFQSYGFPSPQQPNPTTLNEEALQRWKNYVMAPAVKAASAVDIDVGIIGHWSFFEGINYDLTFNNCNDSGDRWNPNAPCMSNNWQVGHGIRPAETVAYLQDAFDNMYGSHSDETVRRVGQGVIDAMATRHPEKKITYPATTFPATSLEDLTNNMQDPQKRTWVAHLMRDDAISMYILARVFKNITGPSLASIMEGWDPSHYVPQRIVNTMKAVYDAGISGTVTSGGSSFTPRTFTLTVRPTLSDTYLVNRATARVVGAETGGGDTPDGNTGTVTGDIAKLLPDPLPADPANATEIKASILAHFQTEKDTLIPLYKEASTKSGIPWQVFAGIHWREGDALPGYSLTSGRPIGGYEPDRAASGDCTGPVGAVDGKADINCAFADGVDDILFVANHLKGKIGKTPATFEELVTALSRYNGTGNVNCYQTPYTFCPPLFDGEDSPYALNFFDDRHSQMYLRYCLDGQLCDYGTRDNRPGAATVTKWVAGSGL